MELLEQIKKDRLTARKNKSKLRASLLTTIVGEAETMSKSGKKVDMLSLLVKFRKGLEETLAIKYTEEAHTELCILEEYLPGMLTSEEILGIIKDLPGGTPMGGIMGHLSKNYKGQFDGKVAKDIVLEYLK